MELDNALLEPEDRINIPDEKLQELANVLNELASDTYCGIVGALKEDQTLDEGDGFFLITDSINTVDNFDMEFESVGPYQARRCQIEERNDPLPDHAWPETIDTVELSSVDDIAKVSVSGIHLTYPFFHADTELAHAVADALIEYDYPGFFEHQCFSYLESQLTGAREEAERRISNIDDRIQSLESEIEQKRHERERAVETFERFDNIAEEDIREKMNVFQDLSWIRGFELQDNAITLTTEDVIAENDGSTYNFGPYKVELQFDPGQDSLSRPRIRYEQMIDTDVSNQHPHANSSGVPCWGETSSGESVSTVLDRKWRNLEWRAFLGLIWNHLTSLYPAGWFEAPLPFAQDPCEVCNAEQCIETCMTCEANKARNFELFNPCPGCTDDDCAECQRIDGEVPKCIICRERHVSRGEQCLVRCPDNEDHELLPPCALCSLRNLSNDPHECPEYNSRDCLYEQFSL